MEFSWDTIKDFIVAFGWTKGTFTIFFWLAQFVIYRQYKGRLNDRQKQINDLAAENREYRERYLAIVDKNINYKPRQIERVSPRKRLKKGK